MLCYILHCCLYVKCGMVSFNSHKVVEYDIHYCLFNMIYVLDGSSCMCWGGGGALLLSGYTHFYVGFDAA